MKVSRLKDAARMVFPAICIYSLMNFGSTFYWSYRSLQARSLGLTINEVLAVKGIIPFLTFFSTPLIGYIGDKIGYKPMLIFCLATSAAELVGFTILPKYKATPRFKIGVDPSIEDISASSLKMFGEYLAVNGSCRKALNFTVEDITCDGDSVSGNFSVTIENLLNTTLAHCDASDTDFCVYDIAEYNAEQIRYCDVTLKDEDNIEEEGSKDLLFWIYLFLKLFWAFTLNPAWNIADSIAITASKKADVDWGIISFFGSISAIISPLFAGFMIERITYFTAPADCITQLPGAQTYQLPFYTASLTMLITLIFTCFISGDDINVEKKEKMSFKDEFSWLLKPAALGVYMYILVDGIVFGIFDGFYAFFLVDELNVSQEWFGILGSIALAGCTVLSLVGGIIHKHIGSMNILLLGGAIKYIIRIIISYTRKFEDGEWPIVLIFTSMGQDTYMFMWVGLVGYLKLVVPKHLTATGMGITSILAYIVGKGLGSFIGTQLNTAFGMKATISICGFIGLGYTVFYFIIFHTFIRGTEAFKNTEEDDDDENPEGNKDLEQDNQELSERPLCKQS